METIQRRQFLTWLARAGILATSVPALLAACGTDEPAVRAPKGTPSNGKGARAIVGDVLDFDLEPQGWTGAFGSVTFKLHKGAFDGEDVYFIRTDASDEPFAKQEKLVHVPRIAGLVGAGLVASAYLVTGGVRDQATVLSTEPGRPDYTPAWRIHRVRWSGTPRALTSVREVEEAKAKGDVTVEDTAVVLNGPVVKWSKGEMPVDAARTEYVGPGQLLEPPDPSGMKVRFKLHECFPGVRYIVTDTALKPMAEGMNVVHSPKLDGSSKANATGRTNVFMNGIKGSGPMGFQPSVFDSAAGSPSWSPYWDHMTYAWKDGKPPRVIRDERSIHSARDAGELEEFPGTPDTKGATFTVNCPVPVLAPNTFTG